MANKDENKLLDHNYDGIQEFDNSLPRWWLYGFYFCIVFAVVYMVRFHIMGAPLMEQEYENEMAEAALLYAPAKDALAEVAGGNVNVEVLTDAASLAAGETIFLEKNTCNACHRADGGGMVGPNLTDNLWIHGCSIEDVMTSIKDGFPDKGMLAYGNSMKLTDEELLQVASYVLSLQGSNPADPKAPDESREVPCE